MTHPDPDYRRTWEPDALRALNNGRHRIGRQPLNADNTDACPDYQWKAMKPADRAALWRRYGMESRGAE